MSGSLVGKLTLVTGAGRGIGEALCGVLLREGSKVAAADINPINPDRHADSKDFYKEFRADVSSAKDVTELFQNVKTHFGVSPDCIVNCAGIIRDSLLFKMTEQQFEEVINVNLKGTFLMCQTMSKALIERQKTEKMVTGGSIVNISSIVGKIGNFGQTNYAASKAGVIGLTKSLAKELGRFSIRCNVVLPGFISTPMTDNVPEKQRKLIIESIPLGRFGRPEEVAELCSFLLSDKSSYITGGCFEVTGGLYL